MNSTYRIEFLPRAEKQLRKLERTPQLRVSVAINGLAVDPRPPNSLKLHGQPGYRLRVGDYRVIYTIDDPAGLITIRMVGPRNQEYRRLMR